MAAPSPLDLYLDEVQRIRATRAGTGETSYYPAIAGVLNLVGAGLRPRVFCLNHVSGGANIPDFGLFEQAKVRRGEQAEWAAGIAPERGVVEAKGAGHSIAALIASDQVRRYRDAYQLVLATNLWQFRLVRSDGAVAESFDLAADETGFWALARGTRPNALRIRFADFLQRCLLTRAPLAKPADVAFFLASYARDALARLSERAGLPALAALREGMQQALGISFDAKDGEHLFRSTLVQTLFYGLFSAWVVQVRSGSGRFDWRAAQWSLTVPVARFLFQQVATPEALEPLDLVPLLDAAGDTLNRIEVAAFFTAFDDSRAVQYFYEPFLEFFDPDLRRELGVWYTPPEIVEYMVERVDRVLRSELGVADGLADPNVWVLDPCCGTGSFVTAVLERIRRTLEGRGLGDLAAERLKAAAMRRVVGFEIMTAPFVIAHWQVGEALRRAGAPLGRDERAAVFLTNALTGWEGGAIGEQPGFPVLAAERAAADAVKQERPILVVLGNPPYNAYAGVSPASEGGLVEPYKAGLRERWGVKKYNLDDLFVRFFRIAERRIAERTGKGVVCYISNFSWLFLPSYTVMRQSLLSRFDRVWIDCLNGDSRETGKLTPDGAPDPSVFSTEFNREGIRVGTAIGTLVRHEGGHERVAEARFRQFWGAEKRAEVLASLDEPEISVGYAALAPSERNRFLLRPGAAGSAYAAWPALPDLARIPPLPGLLEKRGGGLIAHGREALERRMRAYLDPARSFEDAKAVAPALAQDRAGYTAKDARQKLVNAEGYRAENVHRYQFFAFDMRWAYVTNAQPMWNRARPQLMHVLPDSRGFLVVRPQQIAEPEGQPASWTNCAIDDHALHKDAFVFPVIENLSGRPRPNLSEAAAAYLDALGLAGDAVALWHHALATLFSPAYLADNAAGIRHGWPRIPLPGESAALRASAALGARLAALLDSDTPVPRVTEGEPDPALRAVAVPTTAPGQARDWRLTAGWGARTREGVTMPGRGRAEPRAYAPGEADTAAHGALLGARTLDVWLNGATCWRNVPERVWEFRVGGYQVLKKWLSYRDHSILDRALTAEDVEHVQATARRIAAILLLGPALDAAHQACAAAHVPLPA